MRRKTQPSLRHEQADLVRIIGTRLKEARELCNLSQVEAARRLGYANSSKLAKIERASDSVSVPIWLILRAAKLYDVSIDFLFGQSDDWFREPRLSQEREVSSWLFEAWEAQRKRDMLTVKRLSDEIEVVTNTTGEMLECTAFAADALHDFVRINPRFKDMRGSAKLQKYVSLAADSARAASRKLTRFRSSLRCAVATTPQLDIFSEPEVD